MISAKVPEQQSGRKAKSSDGQISMHIEPPVVLSPAEPSETDGNFRQNWHGTSAELKK